MSQDGSQKAVALYIFPEAQRGLAEGHRPWDLQPNNTMTNATVDDQVASADGPVLTLKYEDGEQKILITPAYRDHHGCQKIRRRSQTRAEDFRTRRQETGRRQGTDLDRSCACSEPG
jgi:hypothetical protein